MLSPQIVFFNQQDRNQPNIITQDDEDNPMTINFIQNHIWHKYPQNLHVTLPPQQIDIIQPAEHYAKPVIHPEKGETITATDPLSKET